jgi:hypothetical protein
VGDSGDFRLFDLHKTELSKDDYGFTYPNLKNQCRLRFISSVRGVTLALPALWWFGYYFAVIQISPQRLMVAVFPTFDRNLKFGMQFMMPSFSESKSSCKAKMLSKLPRCWNVEWKDCYHAHETLSRGVFRFLCPAETTRLSALMRKTFNLVKKSLREHQVLTFATGNNR